MSAVKELENLGAIVEEISLPHCQYGIPVYYVLAPAECSSNLNRYDGVKFGFRSKNFSNLEDMIVNSRSEGLGAEPKRRILIGTYVLSQGYYDAYYLKAQKVRNLIKKDFVDLFKNFDCLVGPVVSDEAFRLGEKTNDPISMYKSDLFTIPASLAGLPAMSIPCGFGNNNMPIGVQLIGNYFSENLLLNIANKYQQVTDWHKSPPAGYGLSFEDFI
jgi:aspartyl-tRNA(Asn)/glutamyl-tRNA(Gln) amidotransferase subunit A